MQAAGMLRGTGAAAVCLLLGTLILVLVPDNAHSLPLQVLPNIPGYIPVYIRTGDEPLEDINPALAEAFHEKQSLENIQVVDDDDGGLDAGSERNGTVYLIGVRQSADKSADGKNGVAPKIALPFELVNRDTGSKAEKGQDRNRTEDDEESSHGRKPIALSKEAIITVGGLPVDVKDLERLAADVEKEETRPNDLYDSSSSSSRGDYGRRIISRNVERIRAQLLAGKPSNTEEDGTRRSGRRLPDELMLRPARDPNESQRMMQRLTSWRERNEP